MKMPVARSGCRHFPKGVTSMPGLCRVSTVADIELRVGLNPGRYVGVAPDTMMRSSGH
jgi:hypothetical protein